MRVLVINGLNTILHDFNLYDWEVVKKWLIEFNQTINKQAYDSVQDTMYIEVGCRESLYERKEHVPKKFIQGTIIKTF